jgi:hypothetical protein
MIFIMPSFAGDVSAVLSQEKNTGKHTVCIGEFKDVINGPSFSQLIDLVMLTLEETLRSQGYQVIYEKGESNPVFDVMIHCDMEADQDRMVRCRWRKKPVDFFSLGISYFGDKIFPLGADRETICASTGTPNGRVKATIYYYYKDKAITRYFDSKAQDKDIFIVREELSRQFSSVVLEQLREIMQ